jgi:hypothetical protein
MIGIKCKDSHRHTLQEGLVNLCASVNTEEEKNFPTGELIEQHKHFDQDGFSIPRIKPRITKRRS